MKNSAFWFAFGGIVGLVAMFLVNTEQMLYKMAIAILLLVTMKGLFLLREQPAQRQLAINGGLLIVLSSINLWLGLEWFLVLGSGIVWGLSGVILGLIKTGLAGKTA